MASKVFSVTSFIWCRWMCHTVSSQNQSSRVTLCRGSLCVCVTSHFVVERKCSSSQQTVLTVCHSVTSQPEHSLSWEIYRSINCLRHQCQHTDCLSFHSWWETTSHMLQTWKIIPSIGVSAATLFSRPVFHNSQSSYLWNCSCCNVKFYILGPRVPLRPTIIFVID